MLYLKNDTTVSRARCVLHMDLGFKV